MLKRAMMGMVLLSGLVAAGGCNTQGVIVVSAVATGIAGGIIEVGEVILKLFGVQ
jgi:hypothetical protein